MNITRQLAIRPEPLVIELSVPHPEGGYDPLAPQVMMPLQVTGNLRIGHTADLADPDAPIVVREDDTLRPGSKYAEGRCPSCTAKVSVGRLDGGTLMILQHRPGCRAFRRLLTVAGLS